MFLEGFNYTLLLYKIYKKLFFHYKYRSDMNYNREKKRKEKKKKWAFNRY